VISKTVTIFSRVLVHKDKYVSRAIRELVGIISALPLDAAYDGNLLIVAILYADGRCEVIDYSCYGAG